MSGPDRWGLRHAPELAEPAECGNVWLFTYDGEDVADTAVYGEGFARACVDDLNQKMSETATTKQRLCACGCGKPSRPDGNYVSGHRFGSTGGHDPHGDDRAVAYYTGAADARNGRPRRVDIADRSMIGDAYTRGYNSLAGVPS